MKKTIILPILISLMVFGCVTTNKVPPKTQLQIREFQTKTFDTNDMKMVMKAMLNVLQDDGFIVKNAVLDLGLLSAMKELDVENKGEAFMAAFFAGQQARWKKNQIIEATANVSEFGNQTKVRVTFQTKILDNKGDVIKVEQIENLEYYQNFYSKVDKGIFIQKEKI